MVRAEVVEGGVVVGEQVPDDDQDGATDGDDGLFLTRRLAIRRYRAPRKVSVRPATTATSPRARAR
ncbi:hypothetical protein Rhow_008557 [Rhodococcus wratislaviensis]|uniref:Uncharacterized protein n=1 Tax=Rhodococcus wratislaviensis TaxID=44752 RepID=A0A402CL45_RHOWR|nr:hypothetical protein Rhow_008557 [Rhodococcus wratislaviensis]